MHVELFTSTMLTYRGHGVTTCEVVVDRVVGATEDVVVGAANVVVGATEDVVVGSTNVVVGATSDVVFGVDKATDNVVVGATNDVVFGVDKATDNVVVEKHVGHVVFVATKNAARSDGHLK